MRLIDADAYMEKFCTYKETGCGCCVHQGYCPVDEPTVEAKEVVHGEWKEATPKGVHSWSKGYARCSACDETIWSGWEMNFCPNCGCMMEK